MLHLEVNIIKTKLKPHYISQLQPQQNYNKKEKINKQNNNKIKLMGGAQTWLKNTGHYQ